jgi:hypothetical protein
MAKRISTKEIGPKCYTVAEFCAAHRIGVTMYYQLKKQNPSRAPDEIQLGDKRLITKEAAARWRAAREAESNRGNAPPVRPLPR